MKKTKLITTICQDNCSYEELKNIINAGTDVIRINLSFSTGPVTMYKLS